MLWEEEKFFSFLINETSVFGEKKKLFSACKVPFKNVFFLLLQTKFSDTHQQSSQGQLGPDPQEDVLDKMK